MTRRTEALLLVAFFVVHAMEAWWLRSPWDVLWACHVACLFIAAGAVRASGLYAAIGLSWLTVGNVLWIFDLATGGTLVKTSVLTHVGGVIFGVRGVRRDGYPAGAWWKATLALLALVMLCRLVTPPRGNVNLSWAVFPGFEKWFPTYPRYFVFLFFSNALAFFCAERLARLLRVPVLAEEAA